MTTPFLRAPRVEDLNVSSAVYRKAAGKMSCGSVECVFRAFLCAGVGVGHMFGRCSKGKWRIVSCPILLAVASRTQDSS